MSTYLSLDLDFFNASGRSAEPLFLGLVEYNLERVAEFVKRRKIPCVAVMNHQQMLRFVDQSGCDTLLNVDTHSDLAEASIDALSCGTWVSYVKWRKTGQYIWHHGYTAYRGDCSGGANLFCPRPRHKRGQMSGWRDVHHKKTTRMPPLGNDIKAVGVCLSPCYVDFPEETGELLRDWYDRHRIPYVKGRLDEHFSVPRRPPT